jgi:metal-responsive CopG/Arc/MetJ family transcriptional regulator
MVQINLRLSKAFLEGIDTTWQEQGFNSRSESLRYAARDAVKHPEFSREGWKQIAARSDRKLMYPLVRMTDSGCWQRTTKI